MTDCLASHALGTEAGQRFRLGSPRVIDAPMLAAAVSFLLSQQAFYITGETIDVNGGYRMA